MVRKLLELFTKKNCKRQIKQSLEFKKEIEKRLGIICEVFDGWIDKKDIVM